MVHTRNRARVLRTRRQIYRSRVNHSRCRGQSSNVCINKYGCKKTKTGTRKSYCRKSRNRHI